MKRNENGYILVTTLLLLAVLTVAGAAGMYKSMLASRISGVTGSYARARQAAEAGLSYLFWYWTNKQDNTQNCTMFKPPDPGCLERRAVVTSILQGVPAPAGVPFVADLYGESIADLEARTANWGGLDAFIRVSPNVRVYQLDPYGVPFQVQNGQWGNGNAPQVAVWATGYRKTRDVSSYPYGDANAGCVGGDCVVTVYALGRHGRARALVRESQGYLTSRLVGVTAITNAPPFSNWMDLCMLRHPTAVGAALSWASNRQTDVLIEATQAPYALGDIPSGTALSSNTNMGLGGKMFRKGTGSSAELTMDSTPLLAYSTHRAANGVRAQWADVAMDTAAADDPWPTLPKDILRPGLAATPDKIRYFEVAGDGQLFALNAYRWAAEQFTCQHWYPNPASGDGHWYPVPAGGWPASPPPVGTVNPLNPAASDPYANGAYCGRAAKLQELLMTLYPLPASDAPPPTATLEEKINKYWPKVTGRISVEDFWRNIRDGRPMFGIVRVMYPTKPMQATGQICTSAGGPGSSANPVVLYDVAKGLNTISPGKSVTFTNPITGTSRTVTIGPNSRLVVYGMLLLDYFYDRNGNYYFDPYSGERSILAIESTDAYLKLEVPMMVNPALPRDVTGADLQPFPTVNGTIVRPLTPARVPRVQNAGGGPGCTTCRHIAGLAAPTGGWFPATEGLIVQGAPAGQGSEAGMMALMDPNWGTNGLVGLVAGEILPSRTTLGAGTTPGLAARFTDPAVHDRLNYYYELMYQTADRTQPQYWPITPTFPAKLSDPFCIGALDCSTGGKGHDGDKLHLLFPSGYAHGWKAALAVLDLHAPEWGRVLEGIHFASCTWDPAQGKYVCNASGSYRYRTIEDLAAMHVVRGDFGSALHPQGSVMGPEIKLVRDPATGAVQQVPFDIVADAQEFLGQEDRYFSITPDAGSGYGVMDANFRDLPSLTYSGGLLDTHQSNNVSGIVYTPSALEWETANKGGIGYISGAVITGLGMYNKAKGRAKQIYVFDPQTVDNVNTQNTTTIMLRFRHQVLH